MRHLQLFETYSDAEDVATELDNWIDANSDFLSPNSLLDKVQELIGDGGNLTVEQETIEDKGGMQYGENWNTNVITIRLNGKDLVKVCTKSDGRYAYGACSNILCSCHGRWDYFCFLHLDGQFIYSLNIRPRWAIYPPVYLFF